MGAKSIKARREMKEATYIRRLLETEVQPIRRTRSKQSEEQIKQKERDYRQRERVKVLTHYGNGSLACVMCGESREPVLSIDHTTGEGGKHRKLIKGTPIYHWLIMNNFPEGFRTLCMNCQWLERRRLINEGTIKLGAKSGMKMRGKRSYYKYSSKPITQEDIEEYTIDRKE